MTVALIALIVTLIAARPYTILRFVATYVFCWVVLTFTIAAATFLPVPFLILGVTAIGTALVFIDEARLGSLRRL